MRRKADLLGSRSYLPPSTIAPWFSLPSVFVPFSFHSPFVDPVVSFWLRGNAIYRNKVRRTLLETRCCSPPFKKEKFSRFEYHRVPNEPPHEAMHAALSEMSSRVNDLNIRQDQTPNFALTLFLWSSSNRKGQAGSSLSGSLSLYLPVFLAFLQKPQ